MIMMDMDWYNVPRDVTKRRATELDKKVFQKQKLFIRTLQCSPELGRHVREVHWTVLDASGQFWGAVENEEQNFSQVTHKNTEQKDLSQEKPPKIVYAPEDGRQLVLSRMQHRLLYNRAPLANFPLHDKRCPR
jgi:hypothetical protein